MYVKQKTEKNVKLVWDWTLKGVALIMFLTSRYIWSQYFHLLWTWGQQTLGRKSRPGWPCAWSACSPASTWASRGWSPSCCWSPHCSPWWRSPAPEWTGQGRVSLVTPCHSSLTCARRPYLTSLRHTAWSSRLQSQPGMLSSNAW